MTTRPFIVVSDLLDAIEVSKALVGRSLTFAYEYKLEHKFYFVNLSDAHDALDELAHFNIHVVLHEK